jgi:tetratricopeptide (TPR) repeat protein
MPFSTTRYPHQRAARGRASTRRRTNARRRLLSTLVAGSIALSCVGTTPFRRLPNTSDLEIETWHQLSSPDFVIYSPASKEHIEAFALDLARFIAVVERLVHGQPPKTQAQIFLMDESGEHLFIRNRGIAGFMAHTLAGFDGVIRGAEYDPVHRHVFLHEFSHYLNLRNTRLDYPTWYSEGFAEFLGSIRTRGNMMEIGSVPPWRLYELESRGSRGKAIDLEEIFSFKRNGEKRDPRDFYAISWATVHFLYSSAEHGKSLASMMELQGAGMSWERAYSRSFSESVEDLTLRIGQHIEILSTGTASTVAYLPLEDLAVRSDWEYRKIPPEEAVRLLGELAERGAVWGRTAYIQRLAEALFKRALELDPDDSRAHAGLAAALAGQEKFAASATHLMAFARDPAPSIEAIVFAGNATQLHALDLGSDGRTPESERLHAAAIALYRRALALQGTNPFALAGLGVSQLASGRFDAARQSLAQAQAHGEWDATLTLYRGRVEQKTGFPTRAREYWNEVIRLGSLEDAEKASDLLAGLDSSR